MSLKMTIAAEYGLGVKKKVNELSRIKLKRAAFKNSLVFLERCKSHSVIPTSFRNRCPLRSKRSKRICTKYQFSLLNEAIYLKRKDFHRNCNKQKKISEYLKNILSEEHFQLVERVTNSGYEASFQKHKERLKNRFERIKPKIPTLPNRQSVITNPVLQVENDLVIPPEAISLLSLGPKYAVTPKENPNMEIVAEFEKVCLSLERKGKNGEASVLRHEVSDTILKARRRENS